MNYYILVDNYQQINDYNFEFAVVGAANGGGLVHTSKLIPKEYKEAMMGLNKDKWIESVNKEHKQMIQDGVFEVVDSREALA